MCGIFGFTKFKKEDLEKARESLHTLSHRGPDQWNDYFDEHIYMGHQRLSILDLSEHGKQPMISPDEKVIITVNGEVYNFLELKKELEDKYTFKSTSDSEVVLYGYIEWGIDKLLEKIDGMYAISIYDKEKEELFLARDRFGKKPLYYTQKDDKFFYSSEIKAFFEFDDDFRVFSYDGIKDWIYHRGSHSKTTLYHEIFNLSPGKYLKIKNSKIVDEVKYYDILDYTTNKTYSGTLENITTYLDKAVEKRLIADVPVGLQLSGGVDSSLIGHFLKKHHSGTTHSFSIGFSEEKYQKYSEEKYANFVAEKEGLTHHQVNITKKDVIDNFEHTLYLCDGMLAYPNTIPINLLSEYSKKYITVALTGEGADELFGGYTKLKNMEGLEKEDIIKLMPTYLIENILTVALRSRARGMYLKKQYSGKTKSILENLNCYISPPTFEKIFGQNEHSLFDDISYDEIKKYPFYKQLLIMDHKTYMYSLLDRQDRASMGAGIETRLPFLDKELIEWAINLDKKELFDSRENKKILKELSASIYGKEFTYRRKMGFPLPMKDWLDDEEGFQPYLKKIFDDDFLLKRFVDMDFVKSYLGSKSFDNKNLNYGDSERVWIKWFLMVLRTTQDTMKIKGIK